jgi:cytidine deaminase
MRQSDWDALVAAAEEASRNAYAPHSRLRVGAALQGRSGRVHRGCNIENASLGLTICAERVALFRAIADGERDVEGLAIFTSHREPLSPCGACRQVLAEFAPDLHIVSVGRGGERADFDLAALLPHPFGLPPGLVAEQENEN